MPYVTCFACYSESDSRGRYWQRIIVCRRDDLARRCDSTHNVIHNPALARRLMDGLCRKFNIPADRQHGMMCGSIVSVS